MGRMQSSINSYKDNVSQIQQTIVDAFVCHYDSRVSPDENLETLQYTQQGAYMANQHTLFSEEATAKVIQEKLNQSLYVASLSKGYGKEIKIWKPNRIKLADTIIMGPTKTKSKSLVSK